MHLDPKNVFRLINSVYVQQLNSEIFPVLNVALVSFRDLHLQNAKCYFHLQYAVYSLRIINLKNTKYKL